MARSLQSVLSQSFPDFEVVVVDDGSTDRSAEIVRGISDPRIRLISQENGGPSKARNTGVLEARGEWVVFLDADDELLPGALEHFIRVARRQPQTDFIVCPFYVQSEKSRELLFPCKDGWLINPYKAQFLGLTVPRTGSCIYRRELLLQCPYDERMRRYEDFEQLFRLYRLAHVYMSHQPVLVCNVGYAEASHARADIGQDFCGYLDFSGKSFWERMCLYHLFLGERPYYAQQFRERYPQLFRRYDLAFIYRCFGLLRRKKTLWNVYLRLTGLSNFVN